MIDVDEIYCMDCIDGMKLIDDNSIDSCITDPPYELGFMGKKWDKNGISNNIEMWKEVYRILKPGAHLLSFGGSRTYQRMTCAVEDAGFEIRDMINWVYGSGFPKSLNVGKAIDKLQGNEREIIDEKEQRNPYIGSDGIQFRDAPDYTGMKEIVTKGSSDWEGWGTALKPAHEPIVLARKPLSEPTVAQNVLKWGTGGINVDGCRIENNEKLSIGINNHKEAIVFQTDGNLKSNGQNNLGRFPANFIHDGIETEWSRFFYCAKASKKERDMGCDGLPDKKWTLQGRAGLEGRKRLDGCEAPLKSGGISKNNHPTVKPIALMEYLIKLVTKENQIVIDPFLGSGTTAIACKNLNRRFIGFEVDTGYYEIAKRRVWQ
jgi:site-specific DNA-methyltransferase (adenine-specific)